MKIAVLGSGVVSETLSNGFLAEKYDVVRGNRHPDKLADWANTTGRPDLVKDLDQAVHYADIIVLAVSGIGAEDTVMLCGVENLSGKIVIDVTNPVDPRPQKSGVLRLFSDHNYSLMEKLQSMAPMANFVKAWSCVGSGEMIHPTYEDGVPTMFICGNSVEAKKEVSKILEGFGWEPLDMGEVESARAIEPLCMLWCLPGLRDGNWQHSFKLLRKW